MNSKVEKWLTTGALVGWVASMGSLVFLAVQANTPRVLPFSSPASAENVKFMSPERGQASSAQGESESGKAKASVPGSQSDWQKVPQERLVRSTALKESR